MKCLIKCKYSQAFLFLLTQFIVIHSHSYRNHDHSQIVKREDDRRLQESNSWKRIVTIERPGQPPVEKKYYWSSSNTDPALEKDPNYRQASETVRRIVTQTLSSDNDNYKKPSFVTNEISRDSSKPGSVDSEKVLFNYTITRSRHPGGSLDARFNQFTVTCPQNEYGNEVVGCKRCQCNNNIDPLEFNNCDHVSGKCLKCLYNTEGDHCEICKTGHYGDATKQPCRACVCNKIGTDPKVGTCDRLTGQCPCLPHVDGQDCGKCKSGFFNLTSGTGCEPCKCDKSGSSSDTCNEFDGQCVCRSKFGGRQCNECPLGQFGDPKSECQTCNCNREGSENQYCDSSSGKCRCKPGKGGSKCNQCARGYFGRFPDCTSCGECFEQWDKIIEDLRKQTQALLDKVKHLLEVGTYGFYGNLFSEIEKKLDAIKDILDGQRLEEDKINDIRQQLEDLAKLLESIKQRLNEYEKEYGSTLKRNDDVIAGLQDYNRTYYNIMMNFNKLREEGKQFKEYNIDDAHKTILDSQNRSREAEKRVQELRLELLEQGQIRRRTEDIFESTSRYNSSSLQNEAILAEFARQIYNLENSIPDINKLVCASTSTINTCDQLCGGALCNKCGGLSCSEGATTKASNAQDLAQKAMDLINQKYNQSKLDLEALDAARNISEKALEQAKLVLSDCEAQKSKFDLIGKELDGILNGVDKFFQIDGTRPAEVRTLGNECLMLSISLKPEQILDLAQKINMTIASLTNIDKILQETAGDLNTAKQLHQQADRAKNAADNILDTVQHVLDMLKLAALEQAKAAAAIAAATVDLKGGQGDLADIASDIEYLVKFIAQLGDAIKKLRDRLNELRKKYAQNELYISQAKTATEYASKLADEADRETDELEGKVKDAQDKLANKARQNSEMQDRAGRLKNEALELAANLRARMELLKELDGLFDENAKRLKDYQDLADDMNKKMNHYIRDIDKKAQHYRDCQN